MHSYDSFFLLKLNIWFDQNVFYITDTVHTATYPNSISLLKFLNNIEYIKFYIFSSSDDSPISIVIGL